MKHLDVMSGEISGNDHPTGAPQATLARWKKEDGVHLSRDQKACQSHDLRELFANYLPARSPTKNYPNLIAKGTTVRPLQTGHCWPIFGREFPAYKKVAKFVDAFSARSINSKPVEASKWREVNLSAEMLGWVRFKPGPNGLPPTEIKAFRHPDSTPGQSSPE